MLISSVAGDFSLIDANNNFFGKGKFSGALARGGGSASGKGEYLGALAPGKYILISTFRIGPDEPQR